METLRGSRFVFVNSPDVLVSVLKIPYYCCILSENAVTGIVILYPG